ncbi:hypothetical protein T265_13778, partial [Opisthorchis viverrini]
RSEFRQPVLSLSLGVGRHQVTVIQGCPACTPHDPPVLIVHGTGHSLFMLPVFHNNQPGFRISEPR